MGRVVPHALGRIDSSGAMPLRPGDASAEGSVEAPLCVSLNRRVGDQEPNSAKPRTVEYFTLSYC